jgi:hypothetical protein
VGRTPWTGSSNGLNGLVLAVGCDLAPASYGGEQHASMTHHSTARDAAELQEHARNGGEGTCVFELLVDAAHERQTHRAPAGLAAHGRT